MLVSKTSGEGSIPSAPADIIVFGPIVYRLGHQVLILKRGVRLPLGLQNNDTCIEINHRYEIQFIGIGTDEDHVHFLVQSVPSMPPTRMVQTIKSITAKEIFRIVP